MSELSWARFIEAGLAHVEQLQDRDDVHEHWMVLASDGSALIWIRRTMSSVATTWHVDVYRPGPRPPGGTSSMRSWVFDWGQYYDDASRLLDDVAALAG